MQQQVFRFSACASPFQNHAIDRLALIGSSVQDIVNLVRGDLPQELDAVVLINGEVVPKKYWKSLKPKESAIVNVRIVPKGGGGKKNPIATILSIAVMVAAPAAAGAILGASATTAAFTIGSYSLSYGTILGGALSMVGRLLISSLFPPPKPRSTARADSLAESRTQFIEGARNTLEPYGVIPVCLGTNRIFPPQAAKPYQETQNNDQYARQLFELGYGKYIVNNVKLGETDISQFDGVSLEWKLNADLSNGTQLFSNSVTQDNYSVLLRQADGYTTRTTAAASNEAVVDFTFNGLTEFNQESGARLNRTVELEMQYAVAGSGSWTPASGSYISFSGAVLTPAAVPWIKSNAGAGGYRRDMVVIDKYSGALRIIQGFPASESINAMVGVLGENDIRICSIMVYTAYPFGSPITSYSNFSDDRQASYYGGVFQNSSSFVPSFSAPNITISSGAIKINDLRITAATAEALRISRRVVFPAAGQYDIRVQRITADSVSDQIIDEVSLTAIKSIAYVNPVANTGTSGLAMRIKGTDQLNGQVDTLNMIASLLVLDYDSGTDTWIEAVSSNPASIYRYVLESPAFTFAVPTAQINLTKLAEWHTWCEERGYTYDRVIDYETTFEDLLQDIASAGRARRDTAGGIESVIVDKPNDTVSAVFTPRNSWDFSGAITYPELPHAYRVEFRNAANGYQIDERIVYDDGYSAANATILERLEYQSCTNADLAYKHGRKFLAEPRLRREEFQFMCDWENLVLNVGDRFVLVNDVALIGNGQGRILTVNNNGTNVTSIELDDVIQIGEAGVYTARIRLDAGGWLLKQVNVTVGEYTTLEFTTPFAIANAPSIGDLVTVVQDGEELSLICKRKDNMNDLTARITAIPYAPEIYDAETGAIPPYESNLTTPIEFLRPNPPQLISIASDESVMLRNMDGSITSRAVIALDNTNDNDVEPIVRVRSTGSTALQAANVLQSTAESVSITGLDDGKNYDIFIYYQRVGFNTLSVPLQINNYKFVGGTTIPDNVVNFRITVSGSSAILSWSPSANIDLSHYKIKYSAAYSGATWATAQDFLNNIKQTQVTIPFSGGTYLIKAVDLLGNESAAATTIITYNPSGLRNVIETLTESPAFTGVKDNCEVYAGALIMQDTSLPAYYYFSAGVNLGAVFVDNTLTAAVIANGKNLLRIRTVSSIRSLSSIRGAALKIRSILSIRSTPSIRGLSLSDWAVTLQYRTTTDDPTGTPTWSAWTDFVAGAYEFWGVEFRLKLESFDGGVTPEVTTLKATVDMPDRIVRAEDVTVPVGGLTVAYSPVFQAEPSVAITIQNGATDDRLEFTSKTAGGFAVKVYNATSAAYVSRIIDYIVSGYGRTS